MSKSELVSSEMMKPMMDLNSKDLPEVAKWEVGKEYNVMLKVKMKRKSQGGYGVPDNQISGSFEIVSTKCGHDMEEMDGKPETKTEEQKEYKKPSPKSFVRAASKMGGNHAS